MPAGDLVVADSEHECERVRDLPAAWRHAREFSPLRAGSATLDDHAVAIDEHVLNFVMRIGECAEETTDELLEARLIALAGCGVEVIETLVD